MRVSITKIESLEIEARDLSVPFCKARQPQQEKGNTAEVSTLPEMCLLGRQGTPAGLSQSFVKRYRLRKMLYLYAFSVGSLYAKRSDFAFWLPQEKQFRHGLALSAWCNGCRT